MRIEKKLDKILNYFELKGHDNLEYDSQNVIWNELAKEVAGVNNKFFLMLLNKLEEDGYIETKTFGYHIITVNGLLFNSEKGYTQKLIDLNSERKRMKNNDFILNAGSIGAAFGTIGLLIWEVYKCICN